MAPSNPEELLHFYEAELFERILPFWMQRGIDRTRGGFYTCFSNSGDRLLHRHKFTWSQGRFVWLLSRLSRAFKGFRPQSELDEYLEWAGRGAEFLMRHGTGFAGFTPRMFRATFATHVRAAGADRDVVRKYMGHAGDSVLDKHYDQVDESRMRTEVVGRIERLLSCNNSETQAEGDGVDH